MFINGRLRWWEHAMTVIVMVLLAYGVIQFGLRRTMPEWVSPAIFGLLTIRAWTSSDPEHRRYRWWALALLIMIVAIKLL